MELKNLRKKFMKWVLVPYIATYSLASGYAVFDYNVNVSTIEQDRTQSLHVRRFKARLGDKEKYFTLVGENHIYTRAEFEFGKKLVEEHKTFAGEVGSDSKLPSGNALLNRINGYLLLPSLIFYMYGTGRFYPSIPIIAEEKGFNVYGLEENIYSDMSIAEKTKILFWSASAVLTAPLEYYSGRFGDASDQCSGSMVLLLTAKRDVTMGSNLAGLIKRNDVDNMLVTVGSCHLDGVVRTLSNQTQLVEIR